MPVIKEFGRLRQADCHGFKARVRQSLTTPKPCKRDGSVVEGVCCFYRGLEGLAPGLSNSQPSVTAYR